MQKLRLDKGRVNHETYKLVYNQVIEKVRRHAEMNATSAIVRIPGYVPGRPVFKANRATRYVVEKLRLRGFEAAVATEGGDFHVMVSWGAAPIPKPARKKGIPPAPRPAPPKPLVTADDVTRRLDTMKLRLASVLR